MTTVKTTEKRINGVELYSIESESLKIIVSNLGCHVLSIFAPDKNGVNEDVVLGFENVEDCHHDGSYMGAVVGRVANRIGGAEFELNGVKYKLKANNGVNHLHGGEVGFNRKIFDTEILSDGILFTYVSPDGEEGYPGKLTLKVFYKLQGNSFTIEYEAQSDKDTIANFTNHTYFNLSGKQENIEGHSLRVSADKIACVDENCLANGEFLNVEGTPFDFREFHKIGERLHEDNVQLKNAGGYDHSFILSGTEKQIELVHEPTGRKLTISTTMPTAQVYTGNFLAGGCNGKHGKPYENQDGVALETQLLPNSINLEENPSVILRSGEIFKSKTEYKFTAE